jgi:hypothetical protein
MSEYSIVRFSTDMLKKYRCDYIKDTMKLFFETVYNPNRGVILMIVEKPEDENGEAVKFQPDCFLLMREFFESLLLSFTNIKDVSKSKKTIPTTVEE